MKNSTGFKYDLLIIFDLLFGSPLKGWKYVAQWFDYSSG